MINWIIELSILLSAFLVSPSDGQHPNKLVIFVLVYVNNLIRSSVLNELSVIYSSCSLKFLTFDILVFTFRGSCRPTYL